MRGSCAIISGEGGQAKKSDWNIRKRLSVVAPNVTTGPAKTVISALGRSTRIPERGRKRY